MKNFTALVISCLLLSLHGEISAAGGVSLSAATTTSLWKEALQAGIKDETSKAVSLLQQLPRVSFTKKKRTTKQLNIIRGCLALLTIGWNRLRNELGLWRSKRNMTRRRVIFKL
jgi:hypothetical protein